jgi:Sec-independent protein translocase protein TatA
MNFAVFQTNFHPKLRLDSLEEANSTRKEVPLAEDDPLLDIVACLQHAISALKSRGREVANAHKEQQGEADLDEANEADAPKKTKMDEGRQKETEPEEDYQVS